MKRLLAISIIAILFLSCSKGDAPQLTAITLNCSSTGVKVGENYQMSVSTIPADFGISEKITWKSSNETVAKVDASGKITALSEGNANITATYTSNPAITKSCQLSIIPITASSIKLSETSIVLFNGASKILTYQIEPNNTTDKTVSWISENPSIATVDQTGNVIAVAPGQTKILVKTANNTIQASCDVTVESIKPTSLTLNKSTLIGVIGQSENIIATVIPSNTTYKEITWKSSNSDVVSVDVDGKLTFIDFGEATITASTREGNLNSTVLVSVQLNNIQIEGNTNNKIENETVVVSAYYTNGRGFKKVVDDVQFKIDNTTIASLLNYSNGAANITFKNTGSTILTATSNKFSKVQTQVIQVVEITQFVKANSSYTIGSGDSYNSGTGLFTGKYAPNITNSSAKPIELISCSVYQTGASSPVITFNLSGVTLQSNEGYSAPTMQYSNVYKPYAVFTYRYASKNYTAEIRNFY